MSLPTMAGMAADYRVAAEAAGRTPHVTSIRFCWPYTSREAALERFGDTALAMARTLFEYGAITDLPGVESASQITLEEFVRGPVRLRDPRGVRRDDLPLPGGRRGWTTF